MSKIIVTYNEVININHLLQEQGLQFKLHLHDACGSQSFTVEPLANCSCEGRYGEMNEVITNYFMEKGIQIRFLDNQLEFYIL